jgi:hypothetical protein
LLLVIVEGSWRSAAHVRGESANRTAVCHNIFIMCCKVYTREERITAQKKHTEREREEEEEGGGMRGALLTET